MLAAAGLEKLQDRKFGDLSGGQKQRVLFALAICGDPDLLFLDEPTVGLDVEARRMLWDEIRRMVGRGKTVLLTTHYLQEADALADRVAVINQGEIIAQGTPAEIKAKTAGKRIRCITSVSMNILRQIPGVTEVKEDREAVEIHVIEAEPVLRELLGMDAGLSGTRSHQRRFGRSVPGADARYRNERQPSELAATSRKFLTQRRNHDEHRNHGIEQHANSALAGAHGHDVSEGSEV